MSASSPPGDQEISEIGRSLQGDQAIRRTGGLAEMSHVKPPDLLISLLKPPDLQDLLTS
jgi:hypothetical protein